MTSQGTQQELTARQREVLELLARGYSNGEIAERLGISLDGAKWHVSELIGKFGVQSRDEVADAWEARKREKRWRRAGSLAGFGMLKAAAGAAGILAIGAGSLVAIELAPGGGGESEPAVEFQVTETAAATTTIPLPNPPDALFSAQEALDVARREAERILGRKLAGDLATPLGINDRHLDSVEWLPGITSLQSEDPDRYWDPEDGVARDVWRFQWSLEPVTSAQPELGEGRVHVDVLIADGDTGKALAALAAFTAAGREGYVGGGENWRSRRMDDRIYRMTAPAGPDRQDAWLNGQPGSRYLALFPNLEGNWCMRTMMATGEARGTGSCLAADTDLWQKLHVPLSFSYDPGRGFGAAIPEITCAPETVRLVVTRSDGQVLEFPVTDPIEAVPVRARFAYLDIGTMPEWFTVESFDAAGNLLGETKLGTAGFTPPGGRPGP